MASTLTKRALLSAAAAGSSLWLTSACRGQGAPRSPLGRMPIPKEFFGMHMMAYSAPPLYASLALQPYLDLGQGSFRIWGADGGWKTIQRGGSGSFDWQRLDSIVNGVRAAGVKEVQFTIGGSTPPWASGGMDTFPRAKQYNGFPPLNDEDWVDFIKALAGRYRGRITAYEIWNEWDLKGTWRGAPEQMVRLAKLAFQTIKAVDPRATVISPTIASTESKLVDYEAFLRMGGGAFCDVIGVHGYFGSNEPESLIPFLGRIRALASSAGGVNKPLWNTEMGINYWLDDKGVRRNLKANGDHIPDDRAAAYVARMMMATWLGGAVRAEFYDMDSPEVESTSLSNWPTDPLRPTPAGRSYQHLARLLTGGTLTNYRDGGGIRSADFTSVTSGRAEQGTVYWRKEFHRGPFPVPGARRIVDVLGAPVDGSSGSVTLAASPLFVFTG